MRLNQHLFCLLVVLSIVSCQPRTSIEPLSFEGLYDFESQDFHPQYFVYHHLEDSSEFHYQIPSNELLYSRNDSKDGFNAQVNLRLQLFEKDTKGMYVARDSIVLHLKHENPDENNPVLSGISPIPMEAGKQYSLKISMMDVKQKTSDFRQIEVNKTNTFCQENYLIFDLSNGRPIFNTHLAQDVEIGVISERNAGKLLYLRQFEQDSGLPAPAFAEDAQTTTPLPYHSDSLQAVDSSGTYRIQVSGKLLFMSCTPDMTEGKSLLLTDDFFPEIKTVEALADALRYISSRAEYRNIENSKYPKLKIDEFWIDCGGSKEKARQLIKNYYQRVEEANRYFSDESEGWKTDRGLIHILFGQPEKIVKSNDAELWKYGSGFITEDLSFTFKKQTSIYSNNHFVLLRSSQYKADWEQTVVGWRNGKIHTP